MIRPPRGVLWDLDGTLADSREYHWRAWRDTMAQEGVTLTRERFEASFGQRNDSILGAWLGRDVDPGRIRRIGDAKEEQYRAHLREGGIAPLPGAVEWVNRLGAADWRQAIASSAPRANVDVMLEALGLAGSLDAIVSAEDVKTGKPDPEVFLTAAERLGVPPARAIVVEDAAAGIEAASRGRMRSIAVGKGPFPGADVVVAQLSDLPGDAFDRLVVPP